LAEKRQAYDWLRQRTPPESRAVAEEDASLYLYSGHQAMIDVVLREAGAYDDKYLQEDVKHLTEVATAIGASYWVASSDDGGNWVAATPVVQAELRRVESGLPEVFRSSGTRVRIYSLACLQDPRRASCAANSPSGSSE
jgi:hypothetical protein